MQKALVGFGVAGLVLVGGRYALSMGNGEEARMTAEKAAMEKAAMEEKMKMDEKTMMEKETMEKAEMMKDEAGMMDKGDTMMKEEAMKDDMMKEETMKEDAMMKKEDQAMSGDESMMKKAGVYAPYEASKLAMANTGDVVLFFKASWCPSCKMLDGNIKTNLGAIPAGLTILEVDYDNSAALKQKYGITSQHTLVQVDANGTLIKKWSGGSTLASVVEKVQ